MSFSDKIYNLCYDGAHITLTFLGIKIKLKINKPEKPVIQKNIDYGDNEVIIDDENDKERINLDLNGCHNNKIHIGKLAPGGGMLNLILYCDNSVINIGNNVHVAARLEAQIGYNHPNSGKINNVVFSIGDNTSIGSAHIKMGHSDNKLIIGSDCLISHDIKIWDTDSHPVMSKKTNKPINLANDLIIGNHCWIAWNVAILKNTKLPDNAIVGYGSVVCGDFVKKLPHDLTENNSVIIAGNPARIKESTNEKAKDGIYWQCKVTPEYINNICE